MPRAKSALVQPIRLGGKPVLSLDAENVSVERIPTQTVWDESSLVTIDWDALSQALSLDQEEARYFFHQAAGAERGEMPYRLAWSYEQTARVEKRLARKIAAAQEKLSKNRKKFVRNVHGASVWAGYVGAKMIEDLQNNVNAARTLLARVQGSCDEAQSAMRQANLRLGQATDAARKDRELALLTERKANPKLAAIIPVLQAEFETAEENAQAAAGALETARTALQVAEAELQANQDAIIRRAFVPELEKFEKALDVLVEVGAAIRRRLEVIGQADLRDLFTPSDPHHDWAIGQYQAARMKAFNASMSLLNTRAHEPAYREATRRPQ